MPDDGAQKFHTFVLIQMPFPILMSHTQSRSRYKQCSNNPMYIYFALSYPFIYSGAYTCEELTSKFRDDIRDLMDLRETQAGVAPLDNAVNTKGTRPGVYPCVHVPLMCI